MLSSIYLVRHGETAWSKSGQHTSRSEIPLTPEGERSARRLADCLGGMTFSRVLTSPRQRARQTCEFAGLGQVAEVEPDLAEWDYGSYEGKRSQEIFEERPDWNLFRDGCPGGESPQQVSDRADRLIARLRAIEGLIAAFSHGHFGRVLGARWNGLPAIDGQHLLLEPASLSILGYEHNSPEAPVFALWNATRLCQNPS